MSVERRAEEEPWQYTMTRAESESWCQGDLQERKRLLIRLAERLMCEAADHGKCRYEIYDVQGTFVADGKLDPGDIGPILEQYRNQALWN